MMNKMNIAGLLGSALLVCGTQAQAEITWNFGAGTPTSTILGNTISGVASSGTVTATAEAWSNTNNGTSYTNTSPITTNAALGSSALSGSNLYALETAYLNAYSGKGLGVKNQDASSSSSYGDLNDGNPPEHSTDNDQRYDSVLFSFSSAIDLNSVTIGWHQTDSDITVLAYTGTGTCVVSNTCTSNVSGKTYAQLLSYGWSLIGQYSDVVAGADPVGGTTKSVNASNVTSSYWLIGAANPLVGGSTDTSSDYVKLLALAGDKLCTPGTPGCGGGGGGGVPEPGTLLLMGAGLLGLSRINNRRLGIRDSV